LQFRSTSLGTIHQAQMGNEPARKSELQKLPRQVAAASFDCYVRQRANKHRRLVRMLEELENRDHGLPH